MTDCLDGDIRDQLPDYVHERLDTAARARVAAHVATCASCAAEVELLGAARRVLTAAAPRVDIARIVATLPSPPQATPRLGVVRPAVVRRQPAYMRPWWIAAVVATVAIGGASIAVIRGITNPNLQMPTPTAEATVVLPDGGRIGELSDDDVQSLLDDIDQFDGVPDENPQPAVPALHPGGTL